MKFPTYIIAASAAFATAFDSSHKIPEDEKSWHPPKKKRKKRKGWQRKGKKG